MFVVYGIVIGCTTTDYQLVLHSGEMLMIELQTTKSCDNAYHSREQLGNKGEVCYYS